MNEFAADFIGAANIIHGELIEGPDAHGRARVRTPLGELRAIQKWRQDHIGKEVLIAFRPEEVSILTDAGPGVALRRGVPVHLHIPVEGCLLIWRGEL